ncbi:MAG TPA: hypothetical protein VFC34_10565 [Puia sp.]|nr:hypothetical protein [Puia sp.]
MEKEVRNILTINGGSSSIKFSLYSVNGDLKQQLKGSITRIGLQDAGLTILSQNKNYSRLPAKAHNLQEAAGFLMNWLEKNARVISAKGSQVTVYVIPTDEELMIAKTVSRVLSL